MKCYVLRDSAPYNEVLRVEEREPSCGVDFCDSCGDCLCCYGSDPCYGSGDESGDEHYWAVHEE